MRNKDYQRMATFPRLSGATLTSTCCGSAVSKSATRTISAQTVDEFGDILPDVSIWVDGNKTQGTRSDINGNFTLPGVPMNAVINFSYVSTITQLTAADVFKQVTVKTVMEGDEIVIVGNKKDNTKDNTMKYLGYGFLALLVLYGVSKMGKGKTVSAKA